MKIDEYSCNVAILSGLTNEKGLKLLTYAIQDKALMIKVNPKRTTEVVEMKTMATRTVQAQCK